MKCTGSWEDHEAIAEWERMGLHLPTINDIVCGLEPPGREDDLFDVGQELDTEMITAGIVFGVGLVSLSAAIAMILDDGLPD